MNTRRTFYWVSVPRLRRVRRMSWIATLLAGLLYGVTVCTTAFPGESAQWIAQVAGLDVRTSFERPLLFLLGSLFDSLPLPGSTALRFNLLAAFFGALLVGSVFRVVWSVVTEYMRDEMVINSAPRVARFAAWTAAVCTTLTLPAWAASTRFNPAIIDAALLFLLFELLFVYVRTVNPLWALLFSVGYGAWMGESVIFMIAFPVMLMLWVSAEYILSGDYWHPRVWCSLLLGFLAYASNLIVAAAQDAAFHEFLLNRSFLLDTAVGIWRTQWKELSTMLPSQAWIPVVITGYFFGVASIMLSLSTMRYYRTTFSLVAGVVLSLVGGYALFNAKGTAWAALAPEDHIPLFTGLITAIGLGLLAGVWRMLMRLREQQQTKEEGLTAIEKELQEEFVVKQKRMVAKGHLVSQVALPLLLLVIVLALFFNAKEYSKNRGQYADFIANTILDRMGERSWVVANDVLDANLLLAAHERQKKIILFQPYRSGDPNYRLFIKRVMHGSMEENLWLRASVLLERNFLLFMEEIFLGLPNMHDHAVTLSFADLWYSSGYQPVAEGVLFTGIKKEEKLPDVVARLKEDEPLWEACGKLLQVDNSSQAGILAKGYREATLRQLSLVMNNSGVLLDDAGDAAGAYKVYQLSRKFNPDNVSALLNLIDLVVNRQAVPEQKKCFAQELENIRRKRGMRYAVGALSRYHGYVRNSEVFLREGLSWVASSSPDFVLATLRKAQEQKMDESRQIDLLAALASVQAIASDYESSRKSYEKLLALDSKNPVALSGLSWLMLRQGNLREAYAWLMTGESSGLSKQDMRVEWAVYYLASGDLQNARLLMEDPSVTKDKPALLALLGLIMVEQNELDQVEKVVLPRLLKLLKNNSTDIYYSQILQARLLQARGLPYYEQARACYLRAMAYRPDVDSLAEFVLGLDAALGDAASAEMHAIRILRKKPANERANFIMGTLRLEKGFYEDAERYLVRSITGEKPSSASLNNYVEAAVRAGAFDKAEEAVRRLVKQDEGNHKSWLLFADVLARAGKVEEAEQMLSRVRTMKADDPKTAFVEARLALHRKQKEKVLEALALLEKETMSTIEKRDLEELKKQVSAPLAPAQ
jgi:tetratricopeptide (TPR) repeat protein